MRPYLYKQPSYRYEQELRFVFGIDPNLTDGVSIVSIEIDHKALVLTISVSPDIPRDEAWLLIDIVNRNQVPNIKYPALSKDEWGDIRENRRELFYDAR